MLVEDVLLGENDLVFQFWFLLVRSAKDQVAFPAGIILADEHLVVDGIAPLHVLHRLPVGLIFIIREIEVVFFV